MKRIVRTAFFVAGISAILCSCTKTADNLPGMDAFIDGSQFTASSTGIVSTINTTATPSQLIMTATSSVFSPGTTFNPSIKIMVATTVGSHNINTDASATVYTSTTGTGGVSAIYGQINIVSNASGKIKGDFDFTCADGTKVASGQFTANN
jgi:hypothetical protein